MFINTIDIKTFNAKQLKVDIQPLKFINKDIWITGSLSPVFFESDLSWKNIEIELSVEGISRDVILNNISKLVSLLNESVDLHLDGYSHIYKCKLLDSTIEKTYKEVYKLTLKFQGYEYKNEVSTSINTKTHDIVNEGNLSSVAIIEILSTIDQIDMVLTGLTKTPITIKNLHANQKIIINGETGSVTEGTLNANKFADVDLWELPKINNGTNHITINRDNVTLTIKYKPRFA